MSDESARAYDGRSWRNKHLAVFLYGAHVGEVSEGKNGNPTFVYDEQWSALPNAVPLSLSMPTTSAEHGARQMAPFLWGLLPENPVVLDSLAREHNISPRNPVALLGVVGEDCAGAVQFIRQDRLEVLNQPGSIEWLDDAEIGFRLRLLREEVGSIGRRPGETGQFSLAGAQSKTALYLEGGRWGVPSGRTPTTHILKPPMPGLRGQVENEHFCLLLARALDFASSNSSVHRFNHEVCIAVERYDRLREPPETEYVRLHQEDMCQALSVMPALKYQKEGGPSIKHVVHLLRDNSSAALEDMRQFLRAMAMNFIILGTDAHAKNFSVLIAPGRSRPQIRLAPLYDVNSYLPYTDGTRRIRMSMSVGGKYEYDEVAPRHWERESRSCGLPVDQTMADIRDVIARCPDAAADVARRCHESGLTHPVVGQLATRIAARCAGLSRLYGKEAAADAQERLAIS
ncbi:MAG TPA: type II toxin-antitoxin system HipA family toxin [Acetobacteraceae bacterium]|nr:type II toxin-antitoxin system HipA family toxin [Acetobacteraceae bacterium]